MVSVDYPDLPEDMDFSDDDEVKAVVKRLFQNINLETELKKLALDGYETLEDYEKYGECFVKIGDSTP